MHIPGAVHLRVHFKCTRKRTTNHNLASYGEPLILIIEKREQPENVASRGGGLSSQPLEAFLGFIFRTFVIR